MREKEDNIGLFNENLFSNANDYSTLQKMLMSVRFQVSIGCKLNFDGIYKSLLLYPVFLLASIVTFRRIKTLLFTCNSLRWIRIEFPIRFIFHKVSASSFPVGSATSYTIQYFEIVKMELSRCSYWPTFTHYN